MMIKWEFIILSNSQQLPEVNEISIKVGNAVVKPVANVRDLGFFLDCLLKKWIPLQQNLWQSVSTTPCSSLLAGTAGYQLDELICIQNMACRVITNIHKYNHIMRT